MELPLHKYQSPPPEMLIMIMLKLFCIAFTVTSVMLLHSGGCEHLHELVLIFACILNANGLSVRLDLLETLQKEEMGAATYYEKVEREADFVVIFCTEVAGRLFINPFASC